MGGRDDYASARSCRVGSRADCRPGSRTGGCTSGRTSGRVEPPLADQLRLVVTVLAAEPALAPVWNWQRNGVPRHPLSAADGG